ncbi:MAG: lipocalin-like domain-containing protein [Muribaculaceae bacterium]|nr:lipocalin-like domain-containing protein [Muribaculaceae bacterium]
MKRLTQTIILTILCLVAATSCTKRPINGDLDGQWQLMSVERTDGTTTVPDPRVYYCFFLHTAQFTCPVIKAETANMSYIKDSSITLDFPYSTPESLAPWGITAADCTSVPDTSTDPYATGVVIQFSIRELTSKALIMSTTSGAIFTLRKF